MRFPFLVTTLMMVQLVAAHDKPVTLPSRDPSVVLPLLKTLSGALDVKRVEEILGRSDRQFGSGRCLFGYKLQDSSELVLHTGDCSHLGGDHT